MRKMSAVTPAEVEAIAQAAEVYRRHAKAVFSVGEVEGDGLRFIRMTPEWCHRCAAIEASPERTRLMARLETLTPDAQADLAALLWLGRGDAGRRDFPELVKRARRMVGAGLIEYLAGKTRLAEYVRAGVEVLNGTCPTARRLLIAGRRR